MTFTTSKKKASALVSNTLTRLQKVAYLIRLSISLLLVLGSESLYSCAHLLAPSSSKERTSSTSHLEMAEERIAERIDANLLDTNVQDIIEIPRPMFETKVTNLQKKTQGQLFIKEYPTASAHAGHFDALIKELQLKKGFPT